MAKKKQTDAELLEEYIEGLAERYDRWEDILENGAGDPSWSDGVNINLVRNHILIRQRNIEELCEKTNTHLPEILERAVPPEMPNNFYAKRDSILLKANELIKKVEQEYDLTEYKPDSPLVEYFNGYKKSIERDDLSYLRLRNFADFQEWAEKSEKKHHDYAETSQGQLGLLKSVPPVKPIKKIDATTNQSQKLNELYSGYLSNIKGNWLSFLNVASNTYQHNFINQVLIYGQNKDVTDLKTEKEWNTSERFLNFGAIPIKVIMRKSDILVEQRLYDVSQTYGYEETTEKVEPPTKQELVTVLQSLAKKYGIIDNHNPIDVIKTVVEKEYAAVGLFDEMQNQERFIKNSVYFLVCKRLSLIQSLGSAIKFAQIQELAEKPLTSVGKTINNISVKLLKPIENKIKEMRINNHGEKDNQRNNLLDITQRSIDEYGERNALYADNDNRRLGNFRTSDKAHSNDGQLSFGALRHRDNEIHGGSPQRPIGRIDVGGDFNGKASSTGEPAIGYEAQPYGATGEEKSTSENHRLYGNRSAHELLTAPSGRLGENGAVQTNLTAYLIGDFFEFYGNNAVTVSKELNVVLTTREINGERISMCGLPNHFRDKYCYSLNEKGYNIEFKSYTEAKAMIGKNPSYGKKASPYDEYELDDEIER